MCCKIVINYYPVLATKSGQVFLQLKCEGNIVFISHNESFIKNMISYTWKHPYIVIHPPDFSPPYPIFSLSITSRIFFFLNEFIYHPWKLDHCAYNFTSKMRSPMNKRCRTIIYYWSQKMFSKKKNHIFFNLKKRKIISVIQIKLNLNSIFEYLIFF